MCGILGIVNARNGSSELTDREVIAMRDCMESRGPDDAGLFRRDNVVLAHRRLAIRDIAHGKQPWISQDKKQVLVYNGEIYNDQKLKSELCDAGFQFQSNCDTELLMSAYRRWGKNCLSRLNGMFAFGVYDFPKRSLFLARDRFGIKPLFLAEINGTLVFASSIAAILAHPNFRKDINCKVLSHYLTTLRLTLGRETIYRNIYQLLPGECLTYRDGTIVIERYWNPSEERDDSLTEIDATELLSQHLKASVSRRLVSDVPVGLFLSGGVDSNTIAALLKKTAPQKIHAACGGGDEDSDDFRYAQDCADLLGFPLHQVRVSSQQYRETWHHLLHEYRTPISTPSDVIIHELAREMKKHVGVVLGGEGADELLCGYEVQHWSAFDYEASLGLTSDSPSSMNIKQQLSKQYGKNSFESFTDHYFSLNSLVPTTMKSTLFQPWVWKEAHQDTIMMEHYRSYLDVSTRESHSQKLYRLIFDVNLEALLSRLDSATMAAGLEARVPFTDYELVETILRVPFSNKIRTLNHGRDFMSSRELSEKNLLQSKVVLRNVAGRVLPNRLAHRKKASFPTPVNHWLGDEWSGFCTQVLMQSEFAHSIFRQNTLREITENSSAFGMMLWPILNVVLWGENEFCGNSSPSDTKMSHQLKKPHWNKKTSLRTA